MSKFVAECPIEGCSFRKILLEKRGEGRVVGHIYRTDGRGHGPPGSCPERNFEVEVEEVEGE